MPNTVISSAQGCLLGQLAGDSLGSLVEFQSPDRIRAHYPDGVRELADGGTWDTIAGQPTDDSEMALQLARLLVKMGRYEAEAAREQYVAWFQSGPFDCGGTIYWGLKGTPNCRSEANGALMRISPLGIFGYNKDIAAVGEWARLDAALTHPNEVCQQANALFGMAISKAVRGAVQPTELFDEIVGWAESMSVDPLLLSRIKDASKEPPAEFCTAKAGWVIVALQNALFQLLHAPSVESGIVDTVMRGGDTDTNAAVCGALLGAVHGIEAIPERWITSIINCRPEHGRPGVHRPRPECFWPVDALSLAEELVGKS